MFLDQELKRIQEAKNQLSTCSDLRRQLIDIEAQALWCGVRRTLSGMTLGLVVAEQVFAYLQARKCSRH